MIPESFVELRRLQVEACAALQRLRIPNGALCRASTPIDIHEQSINADNCLFSVRIVAIELRVSDRAELLTAPAKTALDALRKAALDEIATWCERETFHVESGATDAG